MGQCLSLLPPSLRNKASLFINYYCTRRRRVHHVALVGLCGSGASSLYARLNVDFQEWHSPHHYEREVDIYVNDMWLHLSECDYTDNHRRSLWAINRLPHVDGLIFLVDSSKSTEINQARRLLLRLLSHEDMSINKPIIVMGSKAELLEAADITALRREMGLQLKQEHSHTRTHTQHTVSAADSRQQSQAVLEVTPCGMEADSETRHPIMGLSVFSLFPGPGRRAALSYHPAIQWLCVQLRNTAGHA